MIKVVGESQTNKEIIILGFYPLDLQVYAHLLEHIFTLGFLKKQGLEASLRDIGEGYISLEVKSEKYIEIEPIVNYLTKLPLDTNLIAREKNVLLAEEYEHKRSKYHYIFRQLLENNLSTEREYKNRFLIFEKMDMNHLKLQLKRTCKEMNWLIVTDEKIDGSVFDFIHENRTNNKSVSIKLKKSIKGDIALEQINFIYPVQNKAELIKLTELHAKLCLKAVKEVRKIGVYYFHDAIFEAWGNRLIMHYSAYVSKEYKNKFIELIYNLRNTLQAEQSDVERIKSETEEYIKNQTKIQKYFELANFGILMDDNDWRKTIDNLNETSVGEFWAQKSQFAEVVIGRE